MPVVFIGGHSSWLISSVVYGWRSGLTREQPLLITGLLCHRRCTQLALPVFGCIRDGVIAVVTTSMFAISDPVSAKNNSNTRTALNVADILHSQHCLLHAPPCHLKSDKYNRRQSPRNKGTMDDPRPVAGGMGEREHRP